MTIDRSKLAKLSVKTVRKGAVILAVFTAVSLLDSHGIFHTVGKAGEFVIGSLVDHMLFES